MLITNLDTMKNKAGHFSVFTDLLFYIYILLVYPYLFDTILFTKCPCCHMLGHKGEVLCLTLEEPCSNIPQGRSFVTLC